MEALVLSFLLRQLMKLYHGCEFDESSFLKATGGIGQELEKEMV